MGGTDFELSANGSGVVDLPASAMKEIGTADPADRMFSVFTEGGVFDLTDPTEENFELMLKRDGKCRSLEEVLTLPLRWAEWSIEPEDGDRGEAGFCREMLTRSSTAGGMSTPFDLVIAQMTNAVTYRRSFFEKVYGPSPDGDRIVLAKLAHRPARTCWLRRDLKDLSFNGFHQRKRNQDGIIDKVVIPAVKSFVYLHDQRRDPLRGASSLETAYHLFDAKQKVRFLWFAFLENQTIPKAIAKVDQEDSDGAAALARKVATLKSGGVVGLTKSQSVETFESSHEAASVFKDAMDWLSAEQSSSVLAGFTDLAQQGSGRGSYALSADQSDFFLRSRQAVLTEMAAAIRTWVLTDPVRLNFGMDATVPKFTFEDLADHHAEAARELFSTLIGKPPDPRLPAQFLDQLTEKVAAHLGLDVDKVADALKTKTEASPGDQLSMGLGAAAALVAEAGLSPATPAVPA